MSPREDAGPAVLDLRLLLPCLVAWAIGARALAWPGDLRAKGAATAVLLLLLLVASGVRYRGRHARVSWRRDGPGVLALTLVATALVLGASAAHESTRRLGPVDELVDERAMIRGEGVVLTEPIVRPGRASGDEGEAPPDQVILRVRLEEVTARFVRADEEWTEVG